MRKNNVIFEKKEIMRKTIYILLISSLSVNAQNLILNGSFEMNSAANCLEELFLKIDYDNTVMYSNHFGDENTTGIYSLPCLVCSPSVYWGSSSDSAYDGSWVLVLAGRDESVPNPSGGLTHYIKQGRITLEISEPLINEKWYKLSFFIKDPPPTPPCLYAKNNYIEVGVSWDKNVFGTHLLTTPMGDSVWTEHSVVFQPQYNEEYISVKVGVNDTIDYSVFIDNFILEETEVSGIDGLNISNKLLKIVDVLGRETKPKKNTPLFYMYSDGRVEKKIIIE